MPVSSTSIESLTQPQHVCSILEVDTSTMPGGYGELNVGIISCPDLVPDLWRLADGFAGSPESLRSKRFGSAMPLTDKPYLGSE
jgi:hypothetical protein